MVYLSLPSVNLRPHLVLQPVFSFKLFRNTPDKFQREFSGHFCKLFSYNGYNFIPSIWYGSYGKVDMVLNRMVGFMYRVWFETEVGLFECKDIFSMINDKL